jgi:hypothetical protein
MSAGDLRAVIDRLAVMSAPGCESDFVSDDPTLQHSVVVSPSIDELQSALALSDNIERMSEVDMLRAMLTQNRLLIRDAIWRRSTVGIAASLRSVSTTVSHSSDSQRLSSGSSGVVRSSSSVSCAGSSSGSKKMKVSPPQVFRCPVCPAVNNEKDFDRHIIAWLAKTDKTGPVKHGHCPGIRDPNHPLLRKFPDGTLFERVTQLVVCIRSLVRPGAYDSLRETSSGRENDVAAKIAELLAV